MKMRQDSSRLITVSGVILDRDGTVIREAEYLTDIRKIRLLPGAAAAIRRLNKKQLPVAIVTNQAAVARGLIDEPRVKAINEEVVKRLARRGAAINHLEYCPHHPEGRVKRYARKCRCRKPAPGMLLRAAKALSLDLMRSVVIGDNVGDIKAGRAVGATTILLLGGHGRKAKRELEKIGLKPDHVTTTLCTAVEWWLKQRSRN